jgi:predicted nuclease with RNAse H fold
VASYLGIDPTSAPRRPSAFAVLDDQGSLRDAGLVGDDDDILALARRWRPRYLAIDAPLSLPEGMCCLEESCPCTPASPDGLKAAERALLKEGIGLFRTTKRSIIKAMVTRAIGLRRSLQQRGHAVMEVYPYASKVRLFGRPIPKKTTKAGRQWLRHRLEDLVPGLSALRTPPLRMAEREHEGRLGHDELDAIVAAYTAYLSGQGRAEAVGDSREGVIYVPKASGQR